MIDDLPPTMIPDHFGKASNKMDISTATSNCGADNGVDSVSDSVSVECEEEEGEPSNLFYALSIRVSRLTGMNNISDKTTLNFYIPQKQRIPLNQQKRVGKKALSVFHSRH